jgi:hypothetical protein
MAMVMMDQEVVLLVLQDILMLLVSKQSLDFGSMLSSTKREAKPKMLSRDDYFI